MALTTDPHDVFGCSIEPRPAGVRECRAALAETARSMRGTCRSLPRTRPLTGRAGTDQVLAATLAAFPWALDRLITRLGAVDDQ